MADLELHVVTPEKEVWTGEARLVIARTSEGDIGILANHAPLLGNLAIGQLTVVTDGEREHIAIDGGFLHVKDNRVDVLAEHAALEGDVDKEEARRQAEELQNRLDGENDAEVRADLAKALTRANLGG